MNVLICIPTLAGRKAYLLNCIRTYIERSPADSIQFAFAYEAPSCGVGWNRCIEKARSLMPMVDYIHFSNDDIVVAEGWLTPLVEAVERGLLPVSRIEPAGVQVGEFEASTPPVVPWAKPPVITEHGYFYADLPENQPKHDWELLRSFQHGALPFCSRAQFEAIGPFIPIHFGTDKWFYERARREGMKLVARQGSVIYNYAAQAGRAKGDWTEQDYLDFDLTVAYPMYVSGELGVSDEHPLRNTPEGLALVRKWREDTFGC